MSVFRLLSVITAGKGVPVRFDFPAVREDTAHSFTNSLSITLWTRQKSVFLSILLSFGAEFVNEPVNDLNEI